MKPIRIRFGLALAFNLLSLSHTEGFGAENRLNLLIITADDLNGDSMGWVGSKVGATPNIDAFAKNCSQFIQTHVSAPICQPSRSALMTGRVPHRNGALGFHPINVDVPTLGEVLRSNGYYNACINKVGHMAPKEKFAWDETFDGSGKNPNAIRDDFEAAMRLAEAAGKPFFINANITDPHRPFAGSNPEAGGRNARGKERNVKRNEARAAAIEPFSPSEISVPSFLEDVPELRREIAQYYTSVRRFDQSFGEIIEALRKAGREVDTIILFLSDHGISAPFSKATVYRNGTWTPMLVRWPGMKKPLINKTDFISSLDIIPTVLDLLAIQPPAGLDGRSFLPLLHGEKQTGRDHVFTHVNSLSSQASFPGRCVRTLSRSYIFNSWPDGKRPFRGEAMAGLSFKAMDQAGRDSPKIKARVDQYLYRAKEEFYDLEKDPDERVNLVHDPKYQEEIDQMRKLLLEHMEKTNDPRVLDFKQTLQESASARTGGR